MRAWYNANLETRWYMVPALIGTLTFLQTLLLTATEVQVAAIPHASANRVRSISSW